MMSSTSSSSATLRTTVSSPVLPSSSDATANFPSTAASPHGDPPPVLPSVESGVTFSSAFTSPGRTSMPYSLFQNLPPVFPLSPPSPVPCIPLDPPPYTAASFADPTFVGSPGISSNLQPLRTTPVSATGSSLADLALTISHVATNVTNIVTTKLLAIDD
ncbi:unnamed protein product [Cuscuta europaea]|uniref:Uncharacterized protein n=1 Tax=Cuscuta europaea TaxID=41803 RepID=A0A9P0ZX46_CUSEU|nr:unnamed protein product [Cuscuta europaea]